MIGNDCVEDTEVHHTGSDPALGSRAKKELSLKVPGRCSGFEDT
jgi:hypothetical protein